MKKSNQPNYRADARQWWEAYYVREIECKRKLLSRLIALRLNLDKQILREARRLAHYGIVLMELQEKPDAD